MTTTKTRNRTTGTANAAVRRVDWSLAPRGAVSATVQSALGLVAVAGVGGIAEASPIWGATGASVGALGTVIVGALNDHSPSTLLYRMSCWAGAGGWLTWMLAAPHTLWTTTGLASLAIGSLGAGVLAPLGRHQPPPPSTELVPAPKRTLADRPGGKLGWEWELRFRRVCRVEVIVTAVHAWSNKAGYDVVAELPPGPATRNQIAGSAEALASDARLPEGCGVEIRPGGHRGGFVAAVATINRLGTPGQAVKIPYPADYSPRSVLDPIEIGEHRDSSIASIAVREDSVLVVGRKRGGKTNQLDVVTLGLGRCRDVLVWHIDMNGGGMSQPWLHAWLEGEADTPPIDWAAPTPQEALLMVTVGLAIALDRKSSYRTLKMQANDKLLPVSPNLPEIVIMVDESAELMSPTNRDPITRQVRDGLEEIQRIAGNEAVNVVFSSLRPTQDMLSPAILKQSATKLALYGLDEADLGHLYGWAKGISMDDLPTKGCAFLGSNDGIRPMKGWYLEPDQIREASQVIAGYRPRLDSAGLDVANAEYAIDLGTGRPEVFEHLYAGRHDRMRTAFTGGLPVLRPDTTPATQPTPPRRLHVVPGSSSAWPDPLPGTRPQQRPAGNAAAWPDPLPGHAPALPALGTPPVPEILTRALQVFTDANDDRMHSETLATALGLASSLELASMLRPHGVRSRPNKFKRNGENLRGYWAEDIATAIDLHARGLPPEPAADEA